MQPKKGCGRGGEMRVHIGFDTRLISMLVQECGVYILTKVEIVDLKLFSSKEEENKGRSRALGLSVLEPLLAKRLVEK